MLALLLLFGLAGCDPSAIADIPTQQQATAVSATQSPPSEAIVSSPYVYGANLDFRLAGSSSAASQMGVTTIRFNPNSNYSRHLAAVHDAGLQPLIILRGCATKDPTQRFNDNLQLVAEAQQVFGADSRVFYEIGNENDLECGLDAAGYVEMWNAMTSWLKQLAPNSWFGGPVNFQQNPSYVAYVVHNATPKPDFVSWHEYTCNSADAADYCIQHIANWTTHISNTRSAITANGDAVPPIMITEWNYAPDGGVTTDDKHNDATFMTQWTTTALQTLIANNVYASYQFNVSDALPLIGSPQGAAFQAMYQQTFGTSGTAPTSTPAATPTAGGSTPTATPIPATSTPLAATATPAATPAPGAVLAQDTFQRASQSTWGTASDGNVWGGDATNGSVFSISGDSGRVASGGTNYSAVLGPTATDAQVLFSGSMSAYSYTNLGAVLRWTSGSNWYKAYIDGSRLVVQKMVNGTTTILGTAPFAATGGTSYTLRFQVQGSTLSAKVWPTGSTEPSDWMVSVSDGTFSSGRVGLRTLVQGGVSATYTSFLATNLTSGTGPTATPIPATSTPAPTSVPPTPVVTSTPPPATATQTATPTPTAKPRGPKTATNLVNPSTSELGANSKGARGHSATASGGAAR